MSAESAIQSVYADQADHVEAALSALCSQISAVSRRGELGMTARLWR